MKNVEEGLDIMSGSLERYVEIVQDIQLRIGELSRGCKEEHTRHELNTLSHDISAKTRGVLDKMKRFNDQEKENKKTT